jgi:hypothetical protein
VWKELHFQLVVPAVWIGGGGHSAAVRSPPMKQKIVRTSLAIPIIIQADDPILGI